MTTLLEYICGCFEVLPRLFAFPKELMQALSVVHVIRKMSITAANFGSHGVSDSRC